MHQSVSIIFSSFTDFSKKKQNNSHISNQIQLSPLMDNPDRFEILSKIRKITVFVANSTCSWLFSYFILTFMNFILSFTSNYNKEKLMENMIVLFFAEQIFLKFQFGYSI